MEAERKERFEWIRDAASRGVPVDLVAQAISTIEAQHGTIDPERLVEMARPKKSPLHPLFDWDDTVAARKWRVHQAKLTIRAVRVFYPENPDRKVPAFVYVRQVEEEEKPGYMTTARALGQVRTRDSVLDDALYGLNNLRRRFDGLRELASVYEAIDEATAKHSNGEAA